ncbi:hypothetical protein BJV74DRAFT_196867 [Russula compacta]|nr:hypothetical protein BJV74DRAFT_196867 [Russula compacta]
MDSEPVTVESVSIPAIPRRRTHHEIIDVDELDDELDQPPSRRSRQPLPQGNPSRDPMSSEIIILDSDDGSEAGPSTRRRHSGARFRSPPPPVQIIHPPPPVPPLPSRPHPRHGPHVFPPDVIRPNAEPFAFERAMAPHLMRPTSHPPPGNASTSRHRPVISLGGGFISSSHQLRADALRRQDLRERERQRYFDHLRIARGIHQRHGFLSQTFGRIFPSWLFGDPTEEEMMNALAFSELAAAEAGPFDFGDDRAQTQRTPHEYRVAYTHPYPPAPGFTHDFESPSPSPDVIDVDEEPCPSEKAKGSFSPKCNENLNTLVCARCLDPLVLGGSNMSENERARRRLWGLRCGHMLDGKCIAELMKPHSASDLEFTDANLVAIGLPYDKSQGPDSSTESQNRAQTPVMGGADAKSPTCLTKAREKGRAIEQASQLSQPAEGTGERTTFAENSSIRSRLRPRTNTGHVAHISSSLPASSRTSAHPSSLPSASATVALSLVANTGHHARRRPKGKGKQKAMEPVILERYEWRCPVALCGRPHSSLHIESRGWVMDETQGAIAVFA